MHVRGCIVGKFHIFSLTFISFFVHNFNIASSSSSSSSSAPLNCLIFFWHNCHDSMSEFSDGKLYCACNKLCIFMWHNRESGIFSFSHTDWWWWEAFKECFHLSWGKLNKMILIMRGRHYALNCTNTTVKVEVTVSPNTLHPYPKNAHPSV